MPDRVKQMYDTFIQAYTKLAEYVQQDDGSEQHMLAIIHSFEYTFELWWKMLQRYLEVEMSLQEYGPNNIIKNAFKYRVIEDGELWMNMLKDRNLIAHSYKEEEAINIKQRIKSMYVKEFNKFIEEFNI